MVLQLANIPSVLVRQVPSIATQACRNVSAHIAKCSVKQPKPRVLDCCRSVWPSTMIRKMWFLQP